MTHLRLEREYFSNAPENMKRCYFVFDNKFQLENFKYYIHDETDYIKISGIYEELNNFLFKL